MKTITVLTAVAALLLAAPVWAAPSGGGPSAPSAPSTGPQINPQESFQQGIEALQAGDCKKAEKKFGEVLSVAPKHPEANYYMGLAKAKCEKDKQAVKYFERAIKERETFIEAREQLALASVRLGDRAAAEAELGSIKKIMADCTAETCDAPFMERATKAVTKIEGALDPAAAPTDGAASTPEGGAPADDDAQANLRPEYLVPLLIADAGNADAGAARFREAVRLINQGLYEGAIDDLYLAQALGGPHPDISNYLGFAHRKLGKFDAAKSYYAQALAMNAEHLGATEYLGELYLELGEMKAAQAQLLRLDRLCAFGCAEREDLARLIAIKESARAAAR
ncbi:MAG: tetratricopeptide repeat protein [Parvularculaceae bacterium]